MPARIPYVTFNDTTELGPASLQALLTFLRIRSQDLHVRIEVLDEILAQYPDQADQFAEDKVATTLASISCDDDVLHYTSVLDHMYRTSQA